jgi:1,4-alpha-glucan branching enzyme
MLGKMPGDDWRKFANVRALYSLMFAFPGKKLLFMGSEIGQWTEWDHDRSVEWHLLEYSPHARLQLCVRDLNHLYGALAQLHSIDFQYAGFEWIDFADVGNSIISFIRKSADNEDPLIVVGNFTPVPRTGYRVGVPNEGPYRVIFNSDSAAYGGSDMGDVIVMAENIACQGKPSSIILTLPPLAVVYLRREPAGARH